MVVVLLPGVLTVGPTGHPVTSSQVGKRRFFAPKVFLVGVFLRCEWHENVPNLVAAFNDSPEAFREELASVRGLGGASAGFLESWSQQPRCMQQSCTNYKFSLDCVLDFELTQLDFLILEVGFFCVTSSPVLVCLLFGFLRRFDTEGDPHLAWCQQTCAVQEGGEGKEMVYVCFSLRSS